MAKDIFGNEITHDIWGNPLNNKINKKNIRQPVGRNQKNSVRIKQGGKCKDCRKVLVVEEYHHIQHVANNGKSVTKNLVALCPECHRKRHIKEAASKLDNRREAKKTSLTSHTSNSGNMAGYWVNPLTGKREKIW